MLTLEKVVNGLGSAGSSAYKDIYKAAKQAMSDRAMAVRTAAAKVSYILLNTSCTAFANSVDPDQLASGEAN